MEPVDPTLPEEGEPGHGKGDGVRDAGLAAPIPAGDNSGIAKGQLRGALVGFEAGNRHAGDAELFNLVQLSAPFCCSKWISLCRLLPGPEDLIGLQHIENHGVLLAGRELHMGKLHP